MRTAAISSVVCLAIGLAFGALVGMEAGEKYAIKYETGFLIEKGLTVDQVLVFALFLHAFAPPERIGRRLVYISLTFGLFMRLPFIVLGSALGETTSWIVAIAVSAAFFTGSLLLARTRHHEPDPRHGWFVRRFGAGRPHRARLPRPCAAHPPSRRPVGAHAGRRAPRRPPHRGPLLRRRGAPRVLLRQARDPGVRVERVRPARVPQHVLRGGQPRARRGQAQGRARRGVRPHRGRRPPPPRLGAAQADLVPSPGFVRGHRGTDRGGGPGTRSGPPAGFGTGLDPTGPSDDAVPRPSTDRPAARTGPPDRVLRTPDERRRAADRNRRAATAPETEIR